AVHVCKPVDRLHRAGLARAVRSEEAEALPLVHREVDPAHRGDLAVALDQSARLDRGRPGDGHARAGAARAPSSSGITRHAVSIVPPMLPATAHLWVPTP